MPNIRFRAFDPFVDPKRFPDLDENFGPAVVLSQDFEVVFDPVGTQEGRPALYFRSPARDGSFEALLPVTLASLAAIHAAAIGALAAFETRVRSGANEA